MNVGLRFIVLQATDAAVNVLANLSGAFYANKLVRVSALLFKLCNLIRHIKDHKYYGKHLVS